MASTTSTYQVSGMSCSHCVASVTEEIGQVAGVTDVAVDLESGQVRVSGDGAIDDAAVGAAVREAGYEVIS
jgi:copper chaperone